MAGELLPATRAEGGDESDLEEVSRQLGRFRDLCDKYQSDRVEIFGGMGAKLLSVAEDILDSVKSKRLPQMGLKTKVKLLKDLITSTMVLFHSERLQKGESTENVAVIIAAIKDLKKREFEEEEKAERERNQSGANES
jgi:hypothetical protein